MDVSDADRCEESFGAPLHGAPNVGFRVPAKPLRFEHWGAHEDLSSPIAYSRHDLNAQHIELEEQGTQEFILVRATDVV